MPSPRHAAAPSDPRLWLRHPFTAEQVAQVPEKPGVYVFFGSRSVMNYVGVSGSLRTRLQSQLADGNVPAAAFAYLVTGGLDEAGKIEGALIADAEPRYNAS